MSTPAMPPRSFPEAISSAPTTLSPLQLLHPPALSSRLPPWSLSLRNSLQAGLLPPTSSPLPPASLRCPHPASRARAPQQVGSSWPGPGLPLQPRRTSRCSPHVSWPWACMSCPTWTLCLDSLSLPRAHCQLLAVSPPLRSPSPPPGAPRAPRAHGGFVWSPECHRACPFAVPS